LEVLKLLCEELSWSLPSYNTILTLLVDRLRRFTIPIPTVDMVEAALRGEKVLLDENIPNSTISFRTAVRMGYFLNSFPDGAEDIVPMLSSLAQGLC